MAKRMVLKVGGKVLYSSRFDPVSGALVRAVAAVEVEDFAEDVRKDLQKIFPNRFGGIASPVPETLDVKLTGVCGFGCPYCYMGSTAIQGSGERPLELIRQILAGLAPGEDKPYQIALGGGEPCGVATLPEILKEISDEGILPSYTTAGHIFREDVIEATVKYAGSVALTYHPFKGERYFLKTYRKWKEALKRSSVRLVVHVIASEGVCESLVFLEKEIEEPGTIVLLAHYEDIGRSGVGNAMSKATYMRRLPEILKRMISSGWSFAYSEGLLPYFLSRPELEIGGRFHARAEGRFSGYIDEYGQMSVSSFRPKPAPDPPSPPDLVQLRRKKGEDEPTVWDVPTYKLWRELHDYPMRPCGVPCYDCDARSRCASPQEHHMLVCAYQRHNKEG